MFKIRKIPKTVLGCHFRKIFLNLILKDKQNKCWYWCGHFHNHGYGNISINGEEFLAHRVSFFFFKRRQPRRLVLHKCDNPSCVNPNHLEEGDHKKNNHDKILRGLDRSGHSIKTHCPSGHKYSKENTGIKFSHISAVTGLPRYERRCKECSRVYARKYRADGRLKTRQRVVISE